MGTLKRAERINVDASPNQLVTVSDATRPIALVEFGLDNSDGSEDLWLHFYDATSGTVTVGTTERAYGPRLVPMGDQLVWGTNDEHSPLAHFGAALTVAVSTTRDGNTSPTVDAKIDVSYYTY